MKLWISMSGVTSSLRKALKTQSLQVSNMMALVHKLEHDIAKSRGDTYTGYLRESHLSPGKVDPLLVAYEGSKNNKDRLNIFVSSHGKQLVTDLMDTLDQINVVEAKLTQVGSKTGSSIKELAEESGLAHLKFTYVGVLHAVQKVLASLH